MVDATEMYFKKNTSTLVAVCQLSIDYYSLFTANTPE